MKHELTVVSAIVLLLFSFPGRPVDAQVINRDAPAAGELVDDIYINGRFGFSIDSSNTEWDITPNSENGGVVISIVQRTDPIFETTIFVSPKEFAAVESEIEILQFMVLQFAPPDPDADLSRMVQTVVRGDPEREYYYVSAAVEDAEPYGLFAVYLSSIEDYWFTVITFIADPGPEQPDPMTVWSDEFWSRFRFNEG